MNQFSYYSRQILEKMNTVESISGKLFHDTHPFFELNFWKAHDTKNVKVMKQLNNLLAKVIDDANDGHPLLVERGQ